MLEKILETSMVCLITATCTFMCTKHDSWWKPLVVTIYVGSAVAVVASLIAYIWSTP